MIKFEIKENEDCNTCDYCGEVHKQIIDMSGKYHESGFVLSRRCAKKFMNDLKDFMRLNPSGVT